MTRRERLERKLVHRAEWAASARRRSDAGFASADRIASAIPMGQPILIGHHSERHHRADVARIDNGMRKGVENHQLAQHHDAKADGLAAQLDRSIFSDDSDAVAQLEQRIAEREAERDRMKTVNRLFRKGDAAGLAALGLDLDRLRSQVAAVGLSWVKAPFEGYQLSNLGARITADRKRLDDVKRQQRDRQAAEEAPGGVIIVRRNGWCVVQFAEKPERAILDALRGAGFHWGAGQWCGPESDLPAEVAAMVEPRREQLDEAGQRAYRLGFRFARLFGVAWDAQQFRAACATRSCDPVASEVDGFVAGAADGLAVRS